MFVVPYILVTNVFYFGPTECTISYILEKFIRSTDSESETDRDTVTMWPNTNTSHTE
jgi:hypothetical protein